MRYGTAAALLLGLFLVCLFNFTEGSSPLIEEESISGPSTPLGNITTNETNDLRRNVSSLTSEALSEGEYMGVKPSTSDTNPPKTSFGLRRIVDNPTLTNMEIKVDSVQKKIILQGKNGNVDCKVYAFLKTERNTLINESILMSQAPTNYPYRAMGTVRKGENFQITMDLGNLKQGKSYEFAYFAVAIDDNTKRTNTHTSSVLYSTGTSEKKSLIDARIILYILSAVIVFVIVVGAILCICCSSDEQTETEGQKAGQSAARTQPQTAQSGKDIVVKGGKWKIPTIASRFDQAMIFVRRKARNISINLNLSHRSIEQDGDAENKVQAPQANERQQTQGNEMAIKLANNDFQNKLDELPLPDSPLGPENAKDAKKKEKQNLMPVKFE